MSFASLCAFNYAYLVSFLSKCHAKNRQEVLAVRTSYSEEVLALLSCSRKEVLAVSRTQAQATLNQPQEELLLANAKKVSCIIFGLYCIHERGGADGHCRYPARSFIFNSDAQTKQMRVKSINTCTCKTAHDNPYCKQPLIQKRYLQCTRDKRSSSKSICYSGDFVIAAFLSTYFTVILAAFQMLFVIMGSLL